ncbi:hypothetical protein [Paraferrimonas haliotis]|uniref:hypothetical protein n=1 Tax=Paraferrimonas haliotis TaxID=2013866 RepID=UPI000BA9415C|nr:hypothetical protein [Paraferrimonas haliotis]
MLINLDTTQLTLESQKGLPEEKGWLSSIPARTEYTLALSPEAIRDFYELQKSMHSETPKEINFSVETKFEPIDELPEETSMSIFLKLEKDSSFITLFDRAKLEFKQGSKSLS